jgi:membrane-associated phospholipid phosphatase
LSGVERFMPWWDPRGDCRHNCSFVSGDVSVAFWSLAPAALVPPPWRAAAYAGALVFGAAASFMRIAFGAHFFTDTVFAGLSSFLVIWLLHGLMYRWPRTRLIDDDIESAIERAARRWRDVARHAFARRPPRTEP